MSRRMLLVILVLCVSGWSLQAAERATLILVDGQRVSGTLDPRGSSSDAELGLTVDARQSRTFKMDEIAVVDFAGGSLRANELPSLPDTSHMLALRNGGVRMGRLIAIVNGDTVVWQEEGAARQTSVPVRQIARIYLRADIARYAYGASGRSMAPRTGPLSSDRRDGQPLPIVLSVKGDQPWTDTGIEVSRGDVLRFDDQGGIDFMKAPNGSANAGGKTEIKSASYPVPSAGVGALIGRIGTNGRPFFIGAGNRPIAMPGGGRLWLGVNDDDFSDNSGAFTVTITRGRGMRNF